MFYFLQPAWLFAAAGVVIPIAVHLWNVRRGKVLRVGSVALLTEQAIKNSSSIKLNELLLLLVRCLLVLLLAMFLAKPQLVPQGRATEKGWVLLPKQPFKQSYTHFKPLADSLLQSGYELHYFNDGFKQTSLNDTLQTLNDSTDLPAVYWQTLASLNNVVDSALPCYVFTDNMLVHFIGTRPGVAMNLHWYTYNNDSTNAYLAKAYKTYNDSVRLVTANNSARGIYNSYKTVPTADLKPFYDSDSSYVPDTSTIHITIYTGGNTTDASYVKAALDAIKQFSKRAITTNITDDAAHLHASNGWLFWLSDKTLPAGTIAKNIFIYEGGKEAADNSWLAAKEEYSLNNARFAMYKFVINTQNASDRRIIWKDGFGNTVLSEEEGNTNIFHFYARFNPAWNNLPWSGALPELMFNLIFPENNSVLLNDNRMVDARQLQPDFIKERNKKVIRQSADLNNICWLIIAVLFFMERFMVYYNKKRNTDAG